MTRKDYVALADAFAQTRPIGNPSDPSLRGRIFQHRMSQWLLDRDLVAIKLQRDNPRFDRARFVRATEA